MSAQWYYSNDGQQRFGPVSEGQLREMIAQGRVRPEHLVWKDGLASWTRIDASELRTAMPRAGAPAPQAQRRTSNKMGIGIAIGVVVLVVVVLPITAAIVVPMLARKHAPQTASSAPTQPVGASVSSPPSAASLPAPTFGLNCADLSQLSVASVTQHFGTANVSSERVDVGEGEMSPATVAFASDPNRRLEFVWDEQGRNLSEVRVYGSTSQWIGPNGITLGQSVSDVEHANQGAFAITDWGTDNGGRGYDWRGGALSRQGCRIFVDFNARGTPPDGGDDLMSDSAAIRSANAVVQGVSLAPNE